jgi:hypothetical protein
MRGFRLGRLVGIAAAVAMSPAVMPSSHALLRASTEPSVTTASLAVPSAVESVSPNVQSGPHSIVHQVQGTYIDNVDVANHSREAFLHIGTPDAGRAKYRSFLQFDVSALAGASIQSATLRLYNSFTGSCSGWWMYANPVTAPWSAATITWATQPGVDTGYTSSANFGIGNTAAGCPDHPNFIDPDTSDGIHRLDVTNMVAAWVSGGLPNHGLRLSAGELGTIAYKDLCSMNPGPTSSTDPCTISYNTPTLEITYNPADPLVAVTDSASASKSIELYDAAQPSTWRGKGPIQTWAPDAYHSISDTALVPTGSWGGGVDVKLRPAGVYGGGQVLVVADNHSGFVGVIPYPALSGRKWAINVGSNAVANVHGIELLPDGNVAVALALTSRVQVYSKAQGENWVGSAHTPVADVALDTAHEVLYDSGANALWALGGTQLVEYPYTTGAGTLGSPTVYDLPPQTRVSPTQSPGGHDVEPVFGNPDRLWIASNAGVTQFSRTGAATCAVVVTATGWPDPGSPNVGTRWCGAYAGVSLIDAHAVAKSIGDDPGSGRVLETWPNPASGAPSWTTPNVSFFSASGESIGSSLATSQYYRARWLVPAYS